LPARKTSTTERSRLFRDPRERRKERLRLGEHNEEEKERGGTSPPRSPGEKSKTSRKGGGGNRPGGALGWGGEKRTTLNRPVALKEETDLLYVNPAQS